MPGQRISVPEPRKISAVVLAISAALAVAVLAARNLYDDEILSLPIISSTPRAIFRFAASSDVHPPGMYLLAHISLSLLPSYRWMNLIPTAIFYAGLCVFVINIAPLLRDTVSRVIFLLVATLHPQLLLWATSFRWYSWWTGLALATLVVALQPRRSQPALSSSRAAALGVLLATLFYINYITLLFALALAVSMAVRYRALPARRNLRFGAIAITLFAALIASQLPVLFKTHLVHAPTQRAGLVGSCARLVLATLASEAYMPWHPLAILTAAALVMALAVSVWKALHSPGSDEREAMRPLSSIVVFTTCFFLLVALSGLGGKPRNALVLIPAFAAAFAYTTRHLPVRSRYAISLLIALWSAGGIQHMLLRTGLAKASMTNRPEQVVSFVRATSPSGCSVVATYDPTLAFAISHSRLPSTLVLSPFQRPIADAEMTLPEGCPRLTLYVVRSYVGNSAGWATILDQEANAAAHMIEGQPQTAFLSFDAEAARKRALARIPGLGEDMDSASRLPDYRYTVTAGQIGTAALPTLKMRLPHFCGDLCPYSAVPNNPE